MKFGRPPLRKHLRRVLASATLCGAIAGTVAAPAHADGYILQGDLAIGAADAVAVAAKGPFQFSANASRYQGGGSLRFAATYAIPLEDGPTLRFGPTVGRSFGGAGGQPWKVGIKASVEHYQPTSFGHVFGLAEYSTIDNTWFALAQAGFQSGTGLEVSAGGSNFYNATTIAVTQKLGDSPVSLRAGYRVVAKSPFIGFSINTF